MRRRGRTETVRSDYMDYASENASKRTSEPGPGVAVATVAATTALETSGDNAVIRYQFLGRGYSTAADRIESTRRRP